MLLSLHVVGGDTLALFPQSFYLPIYQISVHQNLKISGILICKRRMEYNNILLISNHDIK